MIRRGVFPGLAVVAGKDDRILIEKYRGNRALEPDIEPLTRETLFDVASLTKPLITAFMAALFIQSGDMRPDDPVRRFLPAFPHPSMTLSHLATHTSGLPAWYPLYLDSRPYRETLLTMPLESAPGRRVNYSCPGYILLRFILESVSGGTFVKAAEELILQPLRLKDALLRIPAERRRDCAPTEKGNHWERRLAGRYVPAAEVDRFDWRTGIIRGETHDGNAHYLGGCAGNAGLFATARAVFRLSGEFLSGTAGLLRPETLALLQRNMTPGKLSHRSFGFKLNSTPLTSAGRRLSAGAFGHNGFTGTSLWVDPDSGMRYILLSNRVHPHVWDMNFNRIRRQLHKALVRRLRESGS